MLRARAKELGSNSRRTAALRLWSTNHLRADQGMYQRVGADSPQLPPAISFQPPGSASGGLCWRRGVWFTEVAFTPDCRDNCRRATHEWSGEIRTVVVYMTWLFDLRLNNISSVCGNEDCGLTSGQNGGKIEKHQIAINITQNQM